MALPTVRRPLTFAEQRYVRVYRYLMADGRQEGGATKRELGALLSLKHDGTALDTILKAMLAAGWLVAGRDRASRFAPTRFRARWDAALWYEHVMKGEEL